MKLLGLVLLLSSFVLFVYSFQLWKERTAKIHLDFNSAPISSRKSNSSLTPVSLRIKSLSVNLPILSSKIVNGSWETTKTGVSYLSLSPIPGSHGNSILYGHNYPNLLGNLTHIKNGDEIEIVFSDQSVKRFKVAYFQTVTPDETHVLSSSGDARLTIYTCTGFLDLKRFVVIAVPQV